ncbi:MAG: 3-hydroxyacyl-CoA dehydrogenase, partial [Frondihabitans sp.]|nr:3-hydroxyacyl-CoA dehydrogenase [Frondihabitans sp.]
MLALSGVSVAIADVSAEIAAANYERLLVEAGQFVDDGLFPSDAVERIEALVSPAESLEAAVADVDFIEEAVPEKIEIKHATLRRISEAARPDAVIGSNTSTIQIGALAEAVVLPERFLGVHFSNPAPFIPGVEIIPHATTSEATVALAEQVVR